MNSKLFLLQNLRQHLIPSWIGVLSVLCLLSPVGAQASAPAPNDQSAPAMASHGDLTLVVWQDRRNGSDYDIYGARVNSAGTVLDNILIAAGPGDQVHPAVASDGNGFLVVWTDHRNGANADIYGARVAPTGTVLDPQGIPICTAPLNQGQPAVASDGNGFLVVWQDFRSASSADLYGTRISSTGSVLDPTGLAISQGANSELNPSVAGNASGYLVVWQDYRSGSSSDIYGSKVTASGVVSNPTGIAMSTANGDQINPAVSSNATDFFVLWQDFRSDSNFDLYGTVVTGAGLVSTLNGVAISTAARDQCNPGVANNGNDYLAVWTDYRDGANYAIYGAKITAASVVANPASFRISSSAGDHYHPAVAQGASGYWVAWQDYRSGGSSDIYGSRLTIAGAVSDPSGVLLSVLGGSVPPQVPTITWGQPANIVYGTLLSGSQLNASANVPGTFQYSPPSGTVLGAGNNQILAVIFTPTDTQTYSSASATVTINVSQVPLTIRADNKAKIAGQPNPTLTATYTGFVNADTSASLSSPVVLTTTATTTSPAGSYPIVASGAVGANYVISFVNGILTVTSPTLTGLTVQPATAAIAVGQTQPFTATAAYSDGSTAVVTSSAAWQSSNPSVATVNNPGSAKGVGAGTAIISASLGGLTASGSLTVNAPTLTGLTVQPATAAIAVGQTQPFTATAAYSDGSTAVVTSSAAWQSSNPSVATVNNPGSAKGVGAGTAIISASLGGLTASGSLTVTGTTHDVAKTFKNSKTISDPSSGSSSPYPSGITVSGFNGTIGKVTVKLMHLHASRANNVNLLLVGPAGQKAVLMSGAGGRRELSGVNVTLDDAAPSLLPQNERISSGSYRPAHYATGFVFRAPAPSGPYTADLSIFNGTAPNGVWKLYLQDSQSREEAALEDGWSLTITASSADHGSDDDESESD